MTQSTAIEDLLEEADRLDALLAADPSPAGVTVGADGLSVTLDATGLLIDAECTGVSSPGAATNTLTQLLDAAFDGLAMPESEVPGGITREFIFDPRNPAPSMLDRLGEGTSDGFSWDVVDEALKDVRGEGRTPHVIATVKPGGAIERIAVTAVPEDPDELAAAMLIAARLGAADAAKQVREQADRGALNPEWAVTRMLSSDPYEETR